jgi:inward rectifier potassium channel
LAKLRRARKNRRTHFIRVGHREIETLGLNQGFWSDLYHRSMTVYWPVFFVSAALIFVLLNAIFAVLFFLGHFFGEDPIANTNDDFLEYFYFSIETLATVGYGDMHPQTNYGHLIATVEIFTGMCFLAVLTGMVFARFSRPRARFVFAEHPVVATRGGHPTLMIRLANARHNTISRATVRLWVLRIEKSMEGDQFRRFYELKVERSEHPMFMLSWTIFHVIDKESPLYGVSVAELTEADASFALNVSGLDDASAQQLYARRIYGAHDIRWGYRYRDITGVSSQGRFLLDYTKFNDVVPEEA